ncbi:MAG: hypothetical protein LBS33_00695, partial [Streptococcaceae bacterium]|nr:hypothetical protein [Streptococcaceae bacterium]
MKIRRVKQLFTIALTFILFAQPVPQATLQLTQVSQAQTVQAEQVASPASEESTTSQTVPEVTTKETTTSQTTPEATTEETTTLSEPAQKIAVTSIIPSELSDEETAPTAKFVALQFNGNPVDVNTRSINDNVTSISGIIELSGDSVEDYVYKTGSGLLNSIGQSGLNLTGAFAYSIVNLTVDPAEHSKLHFDLSGISANPTEGTLGIKAGNNVYGTAFNFDFTFNTVKLNLANQATLLDTQDTNTPSYTAVLDIIGGHLERALQASDFAFTGAFEFAAITEISAGNVSGSSQVTVKFTRPVNYTRGRATLGTIAINSGLAYQSDDSKVTVAKAASLNDTYQPKF